MTAFKVDSDTVFWNRSLMGFGVRVNPSSDNVYVARARGPKGRKRVTVGRHGVIGTAEARRRAASIIMRIKLGEEPMPPLAARIPDGPTVANLAERCLEDHVTVDCKPTTARDARCVVYRYILPALGRLSLEAVEPGQVENLHQ
ncbi:MAG: Arm DNA-binding domain-containing protein [bacterium]|nr:Arm DNA-binding domain-containing protein [bacterium]MDE0416894.1 Arm DNA-binding domain-containing protein [bacterium]